MLNKKTILFLSISLFFNSLLFSQEHLNIQIENTIGININTRSGFIGGFTFSNHKTIKPKTQRIIAFEIVNVKHPKEVRVVSPITNNTFILHKQNYLFAFRPQYGLKKVIFRKDPFEGVQVSLLTCAGPTIGLLSPYIINYQESTDKTTSGQYNPIHHPNPNQITGSGGIFKSIGKAKMIPGIHAKIGMHFEYGSYKNSISSLEIGFLVENYFKKVNIMPEMEEFPKPESFISSAYLIISIGKRKKI